MPAKTDNFLPNVHLFRGVAILAVVATHVLFELDWRPERRTEFRICVSLMQNGTVLFVFIAGLLFRHLANRFRYATYLRTKLKYVILPYVLVSLPFVALQYVQGFGLFAPERHPNVWTVATSFLTGDQMRIPLWFVPMIAVFYVLAPAFLWLDRQRYGYWLLPALFLLASFLHRPAHQTHLRQTVPYFLPVYLLGMYAGKNLLPVMRGVRRWRWGLLGIAVALTVFEVLTRERPGAIESRSPFSTERGVFDVNIYIKVILSLFVLEALQRCPKQLRRPLDYLAKVSFGVFFLHYYFVHWGKYYRDTTATQIEGSVLSVLGVTALVTALTVLAVAGVKRLFGQRSRYVVGC